MNISSARGSHSAARAFRDMDDAGPLRGAVARPGSIVPMDYSVRIAEIINLSSSANSLLKKRVLAMRARGVDNRIICMDGPHIQTLRDLGIPVHTVHLPRGHNPWRALQAFLEIASYLRRERIHLVHTHCSVPGFVGRLAARMAGVPVVMHTVHGFHFHEHSGALDRAFYLQLEKVAGWCTDMLLSQNRTDLEEAREHRIVPVLQLQLIGNGIDLDSFKPIRRVGPPNAEAIITCVARFEPVKNHGLLFDAAKLLKDRGAKFRIWLVGEGPLRETWERRCQELGIADRVEFLGYRDDMPEILAQTDIAVLPSVKEGIPRAVLEAMGMEVPVVATRVIGTKEAVRDNETGFMVELGDPAALAVALQRLIEDPELGRRLGRRGREVALADFDEGVIVTKLMRIYRSLLARKGIEGRWQLA